MVDSDLIGRLKVRLNESMTGSIAEEFIPYVVDRERQEDDVMVEHDGRVISVKDLESARKVVSWFSKYPAPTQEIIDVMELGEKAGKGSHPENFVVYFINESTLDIEIPSANVIHNGNFCKVFMTTDMSLAKKSEVPWPGAYGYNASDGFWYVLPLNDGNAKRILGLASLPMFGFISIKNSLLYGYLENGRIFYIFFAINQSDAVMKGFVNLLGSFRYDLRVSLVVNPGLYLDLKSYGLSEEDLPGCISMNGKNGGKFVKKNVTPQNITSFVTDVMNGDAELFYLSQEVPEDNDDRNVKVITRNSIKQYLEDNTRDKLIVFGYPECPHCKALDSVLEELGDVIKTHASEKISIGYYNTRKNETDWVDFSYVPTLILYKAGSGRDDGVTYGGEQKTFEAIATFIKENGRLGVDLSKLAPQIKDTNQKKKEPMAGIQHPVGGNSDL